MAHLLYVALGGAIGASLRHLSGLAALRFLGAGFPYGTFFVNVVGSFLMGCLLYTSPSPRDLSTSRMPSSA